ncbi:MAG: hypothetical protein U0992_10030 [Planctomycetaceae bacterium]
MRSIIAQQISWKARAIWERLHRLGSNRRPTPEVIAAIPIEERQIGLSQQKARYLHDPRGGVADGRAWLSRAHAWPTMR